MGEISNDRVIVKTNWKDTMWMVTLVSFQESIQEFYRGDEGKTQKTKLEYSVFKPGMSRIPGNADNTQQ
jgi:hypothetical protein